MNLPVSCSLHAVMLEMSDRTSVEKKRFVDFVFIIIFYQGIANLYVVQSHTSYIYVGPGSVVQACSLMTKTKKCILNCLLFRLKNFLSCYWPIVVCDT